MDNQHFIIGNQLVHIYRYEQCHTYETSGSRN